MASKLDPKPADKTGENSKNCYPYAQYVKMKKGGRGSTYGSVGLWKSLRIMQVSITLGDSSWLLWKHTRKTKLGKKQRIEGDGAMQTCTASNQQNRKSISYMGKGLIRS